MKDSQGYTYARKGELKPGDRVQVDAGFVDDKGHCIHPWALRTVRECKEGLYISCTHKRHLLAGQLKHGSYVGIYVCRPST